MAINPVLAQDAITGELFPLTIPGEIFFLKRKGIAFKGVMPTRTLKGHGCFFLTSRRIVFLKDGKPEQHTDFTSFELPLFLTTNPKFEQPIFGANYMKGKVNPLPNADNPTPGTTSWSLTFNKGGCGTFLNLFYRLYADAMRDTESIPPPDLTDQLLYGSNAAFVDPNDPSFIYVSQPTPMSNYPGPSAPGPPPYVMPGAPPPYVMPGAPPPNVMPGAPPPYTAPI